MAEPIEVALIDTIRALEIDVLIIDPFVSTHTAPESDNAAIDAVMGTWRRIAHATKCAIELVHHTRKMAPGVARTIEDMRGASSMLAAARDARLFARMTPEEAATLGIEEAHAWRHFRVADTKANMAPPPERATWMRLESVDLGNATAERPADSVGVATQFTPSATFDGVSHAAIDRVMRAIGASGECRRDERATAWVGHLIGDVLGIDVRSPIGKGQVKRMVRAWLDSGALIEVERENKARQQKVFVAIGNWTFSTCAEHSDEAEVDS